jgi:hypothetical protein
MEILCKGKKAGEIYERVKSKLVHYKETGKLQIKDVNFNDAGLEGVATGTGFKAKLKCHDEKLVVDLELNFLLKAMRGQIEEGIRTSLSKALS